MRPLIFNLYLVPQNVFLVFNSILLLQTVQLRCKLTLFDIIIIIITEYLLSFLSKY